MSEVVERMARAMCRAKGHFDPEIGWRIYVHPAKAALLAIREPTEGMVEAGEIGMASTLCATEAPSAWQAMVDKALEG